MEMMKYKLGDVCTFINGRAYSQPELLDSGKYKVLRVGNIFDGNHWYYSDMELEEDKYCNEGDLLYSWACTFGPYIWHGPKTIYHYHIWKVKQNDSLVDKSFLYYFLNHQTKGFMGSTHGSTMIHITKENMENFEVLLPPLSEQKKIASVLSALDDKIALNKKMNQKLEAMAKRLYDYWFVQYDFPDKNGHPYKTTGGPMTYNPTLKREIPAGWEVKQICDIASFEKESVRPSDNPNIEYKHFSIPGYDECGSYVLETGESILSDKFKVSKTDVLVSKLNPWTSRVIWGESQEHQICSTEFVVMKLHKLKEKGFLYSLVKQPSFIDYCTRGSSGTSHSHRRVNPEYMMDYIFAYDKDAVQCFSAIVSRYALMMMKNLRENRRLTALRDKLLPLLMNGQVTVA